MKHQTLHKRQSRLVAQADSTDVAMQPWMDACLASVDGWTACAIAPAHHH
ncbi:antitoxin MazE-like protein [Extensimonas vulgaris]